MNLFEYLKDLTDAAKDRIKTPITGSFSLAFVIYNWRPIFLLLFSKASIEDKIVVINHEYCGWGALLWPLGIAIIYVIGVPYIMMIMEWILERAVKNRKKVKSKQRLLDEELKEEILSQRFRNTQIESGEKDIKQLNDTIRTLQEQIDTTNDQHQKIIENYNQIITNHKQKQEDDADMIRYERDQQKASEKEISRILDFTGLQEKLDRLTDAEKESFKNFSDYYIRNTSVFATTTDYDKKKFIDLELVERKNGVYQFTMIGDLLRNYLN